MAAVDGKAVEDIVLEAATADAPVSSLPTSSADLFGGELGVDELNGESLCHPFFHFPPIRSIQMPSDVY